MDRVAIFAPPETSPMPPLSAREIQISDYDYDLPDERIARHPTTARDGAKQLVYSAGDGSIIDDHFANLADNLPAGTFLVGNQTRVIHARLHFPLAEGKRPIEIFCLEPLHPIDHQQNLGARSPVQWKVLIGGNRRWKRGALTLEVPTSNGSVVVKAERTGREGATFTVEFDWSTEGPMERPTFGEVLEAAGTLPLPPYLGRETEQADEDRYQTVFAKVEGSVAAPTAGLHFTPELMERLADRGTHWGEVTLHVGAGTFRPVSTPTLGGHDMHRETFMVSYELIKRIAEQLNAQRPVVSVGTTTLRCLESLHVFGAELLLGRRKAEASSFSVGQWAMEDAAVREIPPAAAFAALANWLRERGLTSLEGYTEILLSPASGVRVVDGLITNFHQPTSTLLVLIAAIVGDDWRRIYQHALANDYRFLSYGDSSLLWRRE